jgi:NAD+ kinase
MIQMKALGVLLRDEGQAYPVEALRKLVTKAGIRMHLLGSGPPPESLDLVIAMGGDGTVLKALDMMPGCPVLAINFGTVGFLTAGGRDELEQLVQRLIEGKYLISERLLLRCEHPRGVTHVVNEVVLRSSWRLMNVEVSVNGGKIRNIRGDGVIVGTPTGTTGYLLSTGAPLVMPDVECFILDGLNEYNFTSRALVLSPHSRIRLLVTSVFAGETANLYIDGNPICPVAPGQEIRLQRSDRRAQLLFFDEHYFFRNLSSRLGWEG